MSKHWKLIVNGAAAIFALLAAIFWLLSALTTVPDNIDTAIKFIQEAGHLSSKGAGCAAVAAILSLIEYVDKARRATTRS
ncbi:MAG: hypothetical protein WD044_01925 [Dongiaceae bacterium]